MPLLTAITDWQTANPIYIGASVTFYTVDEDGERTSTPATIYADAEAAVAAANPQVLDGEGKFSAPVYFDDPVIGVVTGPHVTSHETGVIINPNELLEDTLAAAVADATAAAAAHEAASELAETNAETAEANAEAAAAIAVAAAASVSIRKFDTHALMIAATFASGEVALRLGYHSAGDGGDGRYRWDATSSATHNDITVVTPTGHAGNGRLLLIFDDVIHVRQGGVRDGPTDTPAATIEAVIAVADAAGVWLDWGDVQATCDEEIAVTLTNGLKWKHNGAQITYTGDDDIIIGMNITLVDGSDNKNIGAGLTYVGDHKVGVAQRYIQTVNSSTTVFYGERVCGKECQDTEDNGIGCSAVQVRGGFRYATLVECSAYDLIRREPTTEFGIVGICVVDNPDTTAYCLHAEIIRPTVENITAEDTAEVLDMDAIGVFAHPELYFEHGLSRAVVRDEKVRGVWGRSVKTQTAKTELDIGIVLLDDGPSGGRTMPTHAAQAGPCIIRGGQIVVDGTDQGAPLINYDGVDETGPIASSMIGTTVRVVSPSTCQSVVLHDVTTTRNSVVNCQDVRVMGEVREFGLMRVGGADKDNLILTNVVVEALTEAMVRVESKTGSAPFRGHVQMSGCVNFGTTRDAVKMNVSGNAAQATLDYRAGNFGFDVDNFFSEFASSMSGGAMESVVHPDMRLNGGTYVSGSRRLYGTGIVANNATHNAPVHGEGGSCVALIKARENSDQSFALVCLDANTIHTIGAGSSFNVGTTSDPGSGTYRIWMDSGELAIKNASGGDMHFLVQLFG